jgi:glycerol-1-phosphate dehydrogenase [NAD(P)+]
MHALAELLGPGMPLLFVHSGERSATGYGAILADRSRELGHAVATSVITDNSEASVDRVVATIEERRPSFVLAVGGGLVVDVGKLAAARTDAQIITVPTQLASDAVCSPVAVVLDATGHRQSVAARMPTAILIDLAVVERAPRPTWVAGLGDLISNLSAIRDWRLAHEQRGEDLDDFACLTAEAAALSVYEDDADLGADAYRQKLIRGLILSGIAMEMAGSSRPASGSEHLISHALDQLLDRPRAHGLQVALGTVAANVLRGDANDRLVAFYRRVGLPVMPGDLGIPLDVFLAAVRLGPSTRPGRSTCLDDVSEADLARLRAAYERDEL